MINLRLGHNSPNSVRFKRTQNFPIQPAINGSGSDNQLEKSKLYKSFKYGSFKDVQIFKIRPLCCDPYYESPKIKDRANLSAVVTDNAGNKYVVFFWYKNNEFTGLFITLLNDSAREDFAYVKDKESHRYQTFEGFKFTNSDKKSEIIELDKTEYEKIKEKFEGLIHPTEELKNSKSPKRNKLSDNLMREIREIEYEDEKDLIMRKNEYIKG